MGFCIERGLYNYSSNLFQSYVDNNLRSKLIICVEYYSNSSNSNFKNLILISLLKKNSKMLSLIGFSIKIVVSLHFMMVKID